MTCSITGIKDGYVMSKITVVDVALVLCPGHVAPQVAATVDIDFRACRYDRSNWVSRARTRAQVEITGGVRGVN